MKVEPRTRPSASARYREFVLLFAPGGDSLADAKDSLADAGYLPVLAGDPDEAIADMHRFAFDALVLSSRVDRSLRQRMVDAYRALRPAGRVIDFNGKPRILLASVKRAFGAGI